MIDESTIDIILRKLNEWGANNQNNSQKCSPSSQTYKHGYREGYSDCIADLTDWLNDLVYSDEY